MVVAGRAVPMDPRAGRNHGFGALARTPGEAHRRLELFHVIRRDTQVVRPEDGRQKGRFLEGSKVTSLSVPRQAVVQGQIRFNFPSVLNKQAVLGFVSAFVAEVRGRLLRVSNRDTSKDAAAQTQEGRIPDVVGSRKGLRKAERSVQRRRSKDAFPVSSTETPLTHAHPPLTLPPQPPP